LILDSNLILSDAQDASTAGFSENIIDTVEVGDAVNELYFVAYVETECVGSGTDTDGAGAVEVKLVTETDGAGAVEVKLVTEDELTNDNFNNPDILWTSGAVPVANLKDKYCFGMVRLPKPEKVKRYIGAQIVPTTIASGKLDIYLTDNPQTNI